MIFLYADGFLYYFIGWYIDNVFPGEFGVPRKFYFFLQPSFWTGKNKKSHYDSFDSVKNNNFDEEPGPKNGEVGIEMQNLTKIYNTSKMCSSAPEKVAVDKLSLSFYKDQITSFLGHNGAGKTTTMSMLTGIYVPSSEVY